MQAITFTCKISVYQKISMLKVICLKKNKKIKKMEDHYTRNESSEMQIVKWGRGRFSNLNNLIYFFFFCQVF